MKQSIKDAATNVAKNHYKDIMKDVAEVEDGIYTDPKTGKQMSRIRGLGPSMAAQRLEKDSAKGRFAMPGQGDLGQFLKKGGKVSSASNRADGIAQRGKTKGRMR